MSKKFLSVMFIVAMVLVLAACGSAQAAEETSAMSLTETDNMEIATEEMEENGTESDTDHSGGNEEALIPESETDDFNTGGRNYEDESSGWKQHIHRDVGKQ